jgi:hypothetical protein
MTDMIVRDHGEEALARLAAAYRDGASDAEALEAATGRPVDDLYAAYFAEYGVDQPRPIEPDPIPPSDVDRPVAGNVDEGGVDPPRGPEEPGVDPTPAEGERAEDTLVVLIALGVGALAAVALAVGVARRAAGRPGT